jgi:hypothetical protein
LVDIQEARQLGIQPLKQLHSINLADLIGKQGANAEAVTR